MLRFMPTSAFKAVAIQVVVVAILLFGSTTTHQTLLFVSAAASQGQETTTTTTTIINNNNNTGSLTTTITNGDEDHGVLSIRDDDDDMNDFPSAGNNNNDWIPPGVNDVRSPCPFINTLANHGFINRSGRDVDLFDMVNQLVLNFDVAPTLFLKLAAGAIDLNFTKTTTTTTTATGSVVLDIDILHTHNQQEHDASFVRSDHYFGGGGGGKKKSQLVDLDLLRGFINETNPESDILTQDDIMTYQTKRIQHSKYFNPEVKLIEKQTTSFSAQAALWLVFGQDPELKYVSKDRLYEFLLYERFPSGYIPSRLSNKSFVPHDVIQPGTLANDIRSVFAENFVSLLPQSSSSSSSSSGPQPDDVDLNEEEEPISTNAYVNIDNIDEEEPIMSVSSSSRGTMERMFFKFLLTAGLVGSCFI